MAAPKAAKWLKLFEQFIGDIRIQSKEVVSQDGRGTPLALWESQKRFIHEVGSGLDKGIHKFNCLKSRQLGVTTVSLAIDVFWLALHPNTIGCLVTDDEKKRDANRSLLISYVSSFPEGYFGDAFRVSANNRTQLKFSNGSRLDLLVAGTKKKSLGWAEGVGYMLAHMTEVSNYGDVEGLKSLEEGFAQVNPSRLFMYESTAKGFNHWQERWVAGQRDPFTQNSFFIGWWAGDTNRIERRDPRFSVYGRKPPSFDEKQLIAAVAQHYGHKITPEQLAWIRWKEEDAGSEQDLLAQNQPWTADQAFVLTGSSFFQVRQITKDIKRLQDSGDDIFKGYRYEVDGDFFAFRMIAMDPKVDDIADVELKIWDEPVADAKYVIGFDPAYGRNDHKDGNAIQVWRCFADKMVLVAEYCTAEHLTKHAAWVLFHLAAAYRDCIVNVEIGGPGAAIMTEFDHLRQLLSAEMNVRRTQQMGWEDAASQVRWYLYHKPDSMGAGYMYNFETNWRTKQMIMHQLRGEYYQGVHVIRSLKLLNEMQNVVVNDGEIGAPESRDTDKKDDRVFAMALATKVWIDWTRKDMLAQGLDYETVMATENGTVTPHGKVVHNIVHRFLQTQEERDQEEAEAPKWMTDNGLA